MTAQAIDVGHLPSHGFGHRSLTWWGTFGLILIEGTVFGLAIMSYLYLKGRSSEWPIASFPPDLIWGTINTAILIASAIPNEIAKRVAKKLELGPVRIWLLVCLVFEIAIIVVRFWEFKVLNVWWDSNAYGSMVWTMLGLHTVHLITDFADSAVLTVLMFIGPIEELRFVDVAENSIYWYFVIASWLPLYAVIYLVPRFG